MATPKTSPDELAAIIAALRGNQSSNGTHTPSKPANSQSPLPPGYPTATSSSTPSNPSPSSLQLPQPTTSGNVDLSSVKPSNSGTTQRDDPRLRSSSYARSRSRSRSPPRRDGYRDNHNPYRDERRDDSRRATNGRDRSASPPRALVAQYSPTRSYNRERSPPRNDDSSEVISVESTSVGLIIGRSGENLRRVEQETGARVQFMPDTGTPMRQCKISGNPRQRADAKSDIMRVASENPRSHSTTSGAYDPSSSRSAWSAPQPAWQSNSRDAEKSIQMMVPDRTVGLIIGRKGETIRDLQERSACHVNITPENKSINGYRPVNLIGSKEAQDVAQRLILEIVESDTRGSAPPGAGAYAAPPAVASPYGGRGGYDHYTQYDPAMGGSINDSMSVPSEAVGMIIGKGGETIRDMQLSTGCKINVSQGEGVDIYRTIALIGSKAAIDAAKSAILGKVETVREKQGGHFHRGSEMPPTPYDPYAHSHYSYAQPHMPPPPQAMPPPPANPADPYAPWGGYENYAAMWYNYNQQGGPSPGH